jgi:hypothetical protein
VVKLQNLKMEKIKIFFLVFVGKGECVAGCPSYNIFILMGECWFFLNDQHSPIIKKINPQNLGIFK